AGACGPSTTYSAVPGAGRSYPGPPMRTPPRSLGSLGPVAAVALAALAALAATVACKSNEARPSADADAAPSPSASSPGASSPGKIARADFNRAAHNLNLPIYWAADANGNGDPDPPEI